MRYTTITSLVGLSIMTNACKLDYGMDTRKLEDRPRYDSENEMLTEPVMFGDSIEDCMALALMPIEELCKPKNDNTELETQNCLDLAKDGQDYTNFAIQRMYETGFEINAVRYEDSNRDENGDPFGHIDQLRFDTPTGQLICNLNMTNYPDGDCEDDPTTVRISAKAGYMPDSNISQVNYGISRYQSENCIGEDAYQAQFELDKPLFISTKFNENNENIAQAYIPGVEYSPTLIHAVETVVDIVIDAGEELGMEIY
jgi:hypothetical protein